MAIDKGVKKKNASQITSNSRVVRHSEFKGTLCHFFIQNEQKLNNESIHHSFLQTLIHYGKAII